MKLIYLNISLCYLLSNLPCCGDNPLMWMWGWLERKRRAANPVWVLWQKTNLGRLPLSAALQCSDDLFWWLISLKVETYCFDVCLSSCTYWRYPSSCDTNMRTKTWVDTDREIFWVNFMPKLKLFVLLPNFHLAYIEAIIPPVTPIWELKFELTPIGRNKFGSVWAVSLCTVFCNAVIFNYSDIKYSKADTYCSHVILSSCRYCIYPSWCDTDMRAKTQVDTDREKVASSDTKSPCQV